MSLHFLSGDTIYLATSIEIYTDTKKKQFHENNSS